MTPKELGIELRREYWRVVRMKVIGALCFIVLAIVVTMCIVASALEP